MAISFQSSEKLIQQHHLTTVHNHTLKDNITRPVITVALDVTLFGSREEIRVITDFFQFNHDVKQTHLGRSRTAGIESFVIPGNDVSIVFRLHIRHLNT